MTAVEPMPIKLLIVDDHQVTRLGLRTLLGSCPEFNIVGEAGTVAEAVDAVLRFTPDLLLLDLRLAGGSGIDVCCQLKKLQVHTRILVLTSYADDALVSEAMLAGADGYLLKEINGENLIRAIREIAGGKSILDPAIASRVLSQIRSPSPAPVSGILELLSPQERRVVALVAEGKTNKQIAIDMQLSDKTVKNYLSNAMEKLNLTRRSQAAALFVRQTR